jgi:hypothetical protein
LLAQLLSQLPRFLRHCQHTAHDFLLHPGRFHGVQRAFGSTTLGGDTSAQVAASSLLPAASLVAPVNDGVVSITNSLSSQLRQYYPQVLDWFEHRDT